MYSWRLEKFARKDSAARREIVSGFVVGGAAHGASLTHRYRASRSALALPRNGFRIGDFSAAPFRWWWCSPQRFTSHSRTGITHWVVRIEKSSPPFRLLLCRRRWRPLRRKGGPRGFPRLSRARSLIGRRGPIAVVTGPFPCCTENRMRHKGQTNDPPLGV